MNPSRSKETSAPLWVFMQSISGRDCIRGREVVTARFYVLDEKILDDGAGTQPKDFFVVISNLSLLASLQSAEKPIATAIV